MASLLKLRRNTNTGIIPITTTTVVGEILANVFDGRLFLRCNNGADYIKEIGAGSAVAQRYLAWNDTAGLAPVTSFEFDALAYLFSQGALQSLTTFFRVPNSYTGSQIFLRQALYTPGVANNFKMQAISTLIRRTTDAINSVTNQRTSTNADQVIPATANQYLENIFDLTDATGKINTIAVSANDIIKIVLSRVATTGTDDTNDVRLLNGSTEILF
jgi:hypothetical protein